MKTKVLALKSGTRVNGLAQGYRLHSHGDPSLLLPGG